MYICHFLKPNFDKENFSNVRRTKVKTLGGRKHWLPDSGSSLACCSLTSLNNALCYSDTHQTFQICKKCSGKCNFGFLHERASERLHQTFEDLRQEVEIVLLGHPVAAALPVNEVDVVGRQQLHQLHAAFERDDVIFDAVNDPAAKQSIILIRIDSRAGTGSDFSSSELLQAQD